MTNVSRPKLLTVTLVCESKKTVEHLFEKCLHVHSFGNLFTSWWNDNNLTLRCDDGDGNGNVKKAIGQG